MLLGKTIEELHELLVSKKVTPLELTKESIEYLKQEKTNAIEKICEQEALDFANINDVTQSGSNLRKLNSTEIDNLATGMVVSRIFKGSIADMFNAIFTVDFALKAQDPSLSTAQKLELANWWLSNKFDQSKFDSVSKSQAKTLFIQKFNEVCNKLK